MTEPGTAVAAGRLLPAACPPGPEAVSRPSLGDGPGGSWGGRWEKVSPPHTPTLLGFSCLETGNWGQGTGRGGCWTRNTDWAGGAGRCNEGVDGAEKERGPTPWGEDTGHLGKLGGRLGDKGEGW